MVHLCSSEELKELAFFKSVNWDNVLDKKVSYFPTTFCPVGDLRYVVVLPQVQPPLIPPRGEVNAADAFDIGNFDDDDTRGIKVGYSPHSIEILDYTVHFLWPFGPLGTDH